MAVEKLKINYRVGMLGVNVRKTKALTDCEDREWHWLEKAESDGLCVFSVQNVFFVAEILFFEGSS